MRDNLARLLCAAEAGDAKAMVELGGIYRFGDGVPRDADAARAWEQRAVETLECAAEAGDVEALYELSKLHSRYGGLPYRPAEALKRYRRAAEVLLPLAEAGNVDAMCALRKLYELRQRRTERRHIRRCLFRQLLLANFLTYIQ